jgi:hypothetical protein
VECRWPRAAGLAQPRRLAPHLAAGRHLRPRVKAPLISSRCSVANCDADTPLFSSVIAVAACRFQEIVPLNAGNVLGAEDNGPARKWVSLVRRTLNSLPGSSGSGSLQTPSPAPYLVAEMDADFERSTTQNNPSFFHRRSFHSGLSRSMRVDGDLLAGPGPGPARLERRYSVNDRVMYGSRPSDYEANCQWGAGQLVDEDDGGGGESPVTVFSPMSHGYGNAPPPMEECNGSARGLARYMLPL